MASAAGDDLDAGRIARVAGLAPDRVELLESVGSTNQWLLQQPWPEVAAASRLVLARRQTAGRGRRGRTWLSGGAQSLTLSAAFEMRLPDGAGRLSVLSVATGLAIAECLAGLTDGIGLKWPNDLQRHGRKVAGLLLESRVQAERVRVVAGLGLNLLPDPGLLERIDQPVGCLFDSPARMPDRTWLAGTLARVMIDVLEGAGILSLPPRWARFDVLAGDEVAILFDGTTVQTGTAAGIDEDGALRLLEGGAEHRICAGEVSVRRRASLADAP
ncbi:MAG: biotin--[acetyl-CoA-carboxylase] ligase [Burkholderiaceae bacterium]|nr:biotin--[acetyl-CoA-carboxylase] ligase [Burkholderiaceae bacterium]